VELRGNIRILARIRPTSSAEAAELVVAATASPSNAAGDQRTTAAAVQALDEERLVVMPSGGGATSGPKEFEFDRVFGPSDGQQQVRLYAWSLACTSCSDQAVVMGVLLFASGVCGQMAFRLEQLALAQPACSRAACFSASFFYCRGCKHDVRMALRAPTCLQVFDEVSALVGSVLDGYNVCIMAYGQTGR
jgi:hypothetical protein